MRGIASLLFGLLCAVLVIILLPTPAYGIANPDTPPRIEEVYVYNNLLEDGDAGVLIEYYLDYAIHPSETATESFMGVLIDTDGTTQLRSVAPFNYQDDGYGMGLIWIYFNATDVTAYSIDRANEALYSVWLVGNPTLVWPGVPPITTSTISDWQLPTADPAVKVAQIVLSYATKLGIEWSQTLTEGTPLGPRLSSAGESYFTNVIPDLRTIAPAVFASGEFNPVVENIDYSTEFGAEIRDGTAIVTGSPVTLVEGVTLVVVTGVGSVVLELEPGTYGTMTNGTGIVTGSPLDIKPGVQSANVTAIGNFSIDVELINTAEGLEAIIAGSGFDLTDLATEFGMSRWTFSGLVWFVLSIIICWAVYRGSGEGVGRLSSTKITMLIFNICIIGGAVLGLVHPIVAALLFIGFGVFTGYILFFKTSNV